MLLLTMSLQTDHRHPDSSGGLIWLSLLFRTTNTEIERLGDLFLELTFSFIFNLSAFTHSFYISCMYLSCTTASHPPFSALNCRTPPPFSITISAFTRQPCRTHPASTHFEWRTLQHPEERGQRCIQKLLQLQELQFQKLKGNVLPLGNEKEPFIQDKVLPVKERLETEEVIIQQRTWGGFRGRMGGLSWCLTSVFSWVKYFFYCIFPFFQQRGHKSKVQLFFSFQIILV